MLRRRLKKIIPIIIIAAPLRLMGGDSVDQLIDEGKTENEIWASEGEELPPVLMLGDDSAVRIYQSRMDEGDIPTLCTHLAVDELVDSGPNELPPGDFLINTRVPRIPERLTDACLIRPEDEILAVGPGIQKKVTLKNLLLRQEGGSCSGPADRGLWMSFEEVLPFKPFFFTTNSTAKEGPNQFISGTENVSGFMAEEWREKIEKIVPFLNDYRYEVHMASSPNCIALIRLTRDKVEKNDEGLANELIVSVEKDGASALAREKVSLKTRSGHVHLVGTLDWNGDGLLDVMLEGDHEGCGYRSLFIGTEDGFDPADLPHDPCGC